MHGILTRGEYRNTGIETFMQNTVPELVESSSDIEPIYWEPSESFPGSHILSNLVASRTLIRKFNEYEKVLVPAQNRMLVDPDKTSAEVIPFVHDILPTTTNFSGWFAVNMGKWMTGKVEDCNEVICGSKQTERELRRRTSFNGESHVVYQGVDHLPQVNSGEKDIDILYVGSLLDRKNPEFTETVLRKAEKQGFRVATVNHDPTGLPGETYVDISDKELAELYARTKYYLHPSMAEGFGRGPVEAQRYGAVPLAFDIPINHEVLGEEGQSWIKIQGVDDTLEKLGTPLGTEKSHEAWQNSERFKWEKTRQQLAKILHEDGNISTVAESKAESYS